MVKTAVLMLVAAAAWPQAATDEAPPPEVDKALRARIDQFFQAHVQGRFRVAEQVVAPDSRDHFFEANKPRYAAYKIHSITYSDNFTKAKAIVNCDTDQVLPGFGKMQVMVPRQTLWKIVDGEWYWYFDPNQPRRSPFGPMKAGPKEAVDPKTGLPQGPGLADVQSGVRIDKSEIVLGRDHLTEQATLTNTMPGSVQLVANMPEIPGLTFRLTPSALAEKETASLSFEYEPPKNAAPATYKISVSVIPTGQEIPITLKVDPSRPEPKPTPATKPGTQKRGSK